MTTPAGGMGLRQPVSVTMVVGTITLIVNLSALVWGAARISAAVDQLRDTTSRLSTATEHLQESTAGLDGRVRVLEDRSQSHRRD